MKGTNLHRLIQFQVVDHNLSFVFVILIPFKIKSAKFLKVPYKKQLISEKELLEAGFKRFSLSDGTSSKTFFEY